MTIYTVTFTADNGLTVTCLAGDGVATISDGYANWDTVDRPRRVGITRYSGRNPFKQDIPIRFDGLSTDTSQESDISTLQRMAQPGTDLSEPPKIKLSGIARRKDLTWVIVGIDEGDATLITSGGSPIRVRADFTVHLLQYVDDTVITTASSPAVAAQTKKKKVQITTPKGMTLKQLAQIEYKDVSRGMVLILQANQWLDPDPRKLIPEGTPVAIPDPTTGLTTEFIVP